jgi:hypothetical protein
MGADLIAYTVYGPVNLKPSKAVVNKAMTRAKMVLKTVKQAVKDPGFDWDDDKFIGDLVLEDLESIQNLDPKQVLKDLLAVWNGHSRDSTSRTITVGKKTVLVLTAGDMSWGDEPDGFGYQTLKHAEQLGILKALGIN